MSAPFLELLLTGPCHRIYCIAQGSHQTPRGLARALHASGPITHRMFGLGRPGKATEAPDRWKKMVALWQRTALVGVDVVAANPTRCKCFKTHLALPHGPPDVCEWKTDDLRILFFREATTVREPRTNLIVTHCFSKKQDDTPDGEIKRFDRLRYEYYQWRNALGAPDAVTAFTLDQASPR